MKGRLELTWTNKHQALLTTEDGGYEWVAPTDHRVSEVRLLHSVDSVGSVPSDRASSNLLIRGDALHGLRALNELPEFAETYVGKVRLAYIDPPFNTGQAFAQYDDALEHSVWLTMIRDRLAQIRPLLAQDGSVWVHLDDTEVHRARSVLDELFGAGSHIASIVWEKDKGRRNDTDVSTVHDTILVYAVEPDQWAASRNLLPRTDAQNARYQNPDDDPRGPWLQGADGTAKSGSGSARFPVTLPSGRVVTPPKGNYWRFSERKLAEARAEGRVWFGRDGDRMPIIKRYLTDVQQGLVPRTWWTADEVGTNQAAKRDHLRRMFPDLEPFATPKPEQLMQRIIHIATSPGDIVLDCFAGSGTTAAVSHKLGRRWVTIESSAETVANYTIPRLKKVIRGEDDGGISTVRVAATEIPDDVTFADCKAAATTLESLRKADVLDVDDVSVRTVVKALRAAGRSKSEVVWAGGGGFVVLDIGPSMFEEIDGRVYLADWAANGALAEATAAQLKYAYELDPPFCGRKGRSRLAVIDGLVNESVVRLLLDALHPIEKLCVASTALDPAVQTVLRELRPGSVARKVPDSLLDEYRQSRRSQLQLASVLDGMRAEERAS
ncbi:MAG: site-specific DNA-methyltransferase [Ilumatobacteraceae bacterium]|nr:site-specific DNA-methyltransferase [Ilumatobacteraceae bacterium]